ncbi:Zinc finger CCHC domain-containing protein 9 [Halotydeus destructor]|nr:Zinc finger CCHC domain-containing protein 9 [Halotydeus destructor]
MMEKSPTPTEIKTFATADQRRFAKRALKFRGEDFDPSKVSEFKRVRAKKTNQDDDKSKQFKETSKSDGKNGRPSLPKKEHFRIQNMKKRQEKNIWLLSEKDEDKIYRVKVAMKKRNCSDDEIKQEVRKMRRMLEKSDKPSDDKRCFNCRRVGHVSIECPNAREQAGEGAKICYRCGSTEHSLWKCTKPGDDMPFASCYICSKTGHISKDCPKNTKGIYPRGGCCKLCQSVNHLAKDCPTLGERKKPETEMTVHTLNSMKSVEEEIFEEDSTEVDSKKKQAKVVKF